MAALFGKKDDENSGRIDVPELPTAGDASAGDAGELQQLTQRLGEIRELLDGADKQVLAYLTQRDTQANAPDNGGVDIGPLAEKIDALDQKLDQLAEAESPSRPGAPADATQPADASVDENTIKNTLQPLAEKLGAIEAAVGTLAQQPSAASGESTARMLGQVRDEIIAALSSSAGQLQQNLLSQLMPEEPEESDDSAASGDWQRAILGDKLAENPALDFQRQQLLGGVLQGEPGACSLVGQLLVFRSVAAEKLPPLLKEVGEAYYRWQPKIRPGPNPMEDALLAWLREICDESGISNTIELVHPGERFDSTRHTAATRGVEIAEVLGWIVLRDNGKVYTKAAVAVR